MVSLGGWGSCCSGAKAMPPSQTPSPKASFELAHPQNTVATLPGRCTGVGDGVAPTCTFPIRNFPSLLDSTSGCGVLTQSPLTVMLWEEEKWFSAPSPFSFHPIQHLSVRKE